MGMIKYVVLKRSGPVAGHIFELDIDGFLSIELISTVRFCHQIPIDPDAGIVLGLGPGGAIIAEPHPCPGSHAACCIRSRQVVEGDYTSRGRILTVIDGDRSIRRACPVDPERAQVHRTLPISDIIQTPNVEVMAVAVIQHR